MAEQKGGLVCGKEGELSSKEPPYSKTGSGRASLEKEPTKKKKIYNWKSFQGGKTARFLRRGEKQKIKGTENLYKKKCSSHFCLKGRGKVACERARGYYFLEERQVVLARKGALQGRTPKRSSLQGRAPRRGRKV